MSKYLLEIGTEELPYRFIPSAIEQLKTGFESFLEGAKVEVYATPRRLAVIVSGLETETKEEIKIIKGPVKSAAYAADGSLTPAGQGFCKKNGLKASDLYIENDYVHAKVVTKGKSIVETLQEKVPAVVLKLQGAHFMRWGYNDQKFSRPIRWIVSILDNSEVKIKIIDKESSNISRGHRFAQQKVVIGCPDDYVESMRNCCVIVDQNERKQRIIDRAKEEAAKLGAEPYYTEDLLDEVTFLTEYPVPAVCNFDPEYLELPEEVTVTVMAAHQRYFALYKGGKLINKFITMTNYIGDGLDNIKAGNLRVIKARLDDAVFFYKEDTKKPLENYVEDLKGITFQKGMGSMYDKTLRLIALSQYITPTPLVERTALLAKADLTTGLVFEFTELQGFIGADYARVSGENEKVVQGIKEHYFPLNAESETASGIEGQAVGIADKIDNICAVFVDGKRPTGSSDPLGIRRAALGVVKTILEHNLKVNISELIGKVLELLPSKPSTLNSQPSTQADITDFIIQRLIIFLGDSYKKSILEACASNKNPLEDLNDYVARVKTVSNFPESVLESANRVYRILKTEVHMPVDTTLFNCEAESMLFDKIRHARDLEALTPAVEKFFEDVLVMDNDENIKNNRLALLTLLKQKYSVLADFGKLY